MTGIRYGPRSILLYDLPVAVSLYSTSQIKSRLHRPETVWLTNCSVTPKTRAKNIPSSSSRPATVAILVPFNIPTLKTCARFTAEAFRSTLLSQPPNAVSGGGRRFRLVVRFVAGIEAETPEIAPIANRNHTRAIANGSRRDTEGSGDLKILVTCLSWAPLLFRLSVVSHRSSRSRENPTHRRLVTSDSRAGRPRRSRPNSQQATEKSPDTLPPPTAVDKRAKLRQMVSI
ncbi:m21 protein [Murine cytomegalovirus (strain K181)]|uniref:M21 protein n=1 Tax=Murid herpesvirus 1 (strain K181) TaxID=69156 RepID=A8E1F2_MUHVK|nr:m21 protein [Murine cytomegalovirus (strain K181)]